jgi:lysophospholipase L1-like esterase
VPTRAVSFLALLLAACTATADPRPSSGAPRALFFGTSTTAGVGATGPERRWTALVAARLGWTEVNAGLSGSTLATVPERSVRSGEARWRADVVAARPDVVVVQYGGNDVLLAVPLGAPGESGTFRDAAHATLRGLRDALPGVPVVVVEPQPAQSIAAARGPYDLALAEAAAAAGATLVRAAGIFAPGDHAADGIHLDDRGHAALAEHVAAALERIAPPGERAAAQPHVDAMAAP